MIDMQDIDEVMAMAMPRATLPVLAEAIPLDRHPAAVYLASLSRGSRTTMRDSLNKIAGLLTHGRVDALDVDWAALRFQHTTAIRSKLVDESYAPATVNKMLAALRGVLKSAWNLGLMSSEDYTHAVAIDSVKGETLPEGRALSADEIEAILNACSKDKTPAGRRDAALIALLRSCGLRRAEVCGLTLADCSIETGALTVRGKGRKERMVYMAGGAAEALADWLTVRGSKAGPMFCPINKGGKLVLRRMTPQAAYNAIAKRAKQAGLEDLSPHDFRRTFVSDLLDAGADISTVQKLAGHANVATTVRYDRRGEAAKRKAVKLLRVPYKGPKSE